ncbi:YjjW family glycine radical enzyme activase [Vibrio marisflavi]|uniref:Glycyl-radical enzyme activating enzyme YjjW n=1 Tax=Vibrio marisflavi CECT 7928 TaxID=634439 RepID=A0ABN8EBR2_9VIBR|nr:YjjW family glycine radical enzyme activase [Vibrio marisflavi]CAH0541049.1 Putative glycyl-radical enzyme activating enzyme YjjW [Vibrio marisflavi CECT 7928]
MKFARVSKVLPFSCVDGPGNRLVIFLQGCNYACLSCHNPYTINHCNDCGECIDTCPSNALTLNSDNKVNWHSQLCSQCDKCIDVCPNQSSPKINSYSCEAMYKLVKKHAPFISGITVSGGEATLQLPFIFSLFSRIKHDAALSHLTCFIDSNGSLSLQGWQKILPYLDGAMVDLKAWKNEVHCHLTGRKNTRVLETIRYLAEHDKLYEIRLLQIPNQTDFEQSIAELAEFINALPNEVQLKINAFRTHGVKGEAKKWQECKSEDTHNLRYELENKVNVKVIA